MSFLNINEELQRGKFMYTASATWDAASIADGANEAKEITVTDVALGDIVIGVSMDLDVEDLQLTADVTATDTVTAVLSNTTGSAVDLDSATVRVVVMKLSSI